MLQMIRNSDILRSIINAFAALIMFFTAGILAAIYVPNLLIKIIIATLIIASGLLIYYGFIRYVFVLMFTFESQEFEIIQAGSQEDDEADWSPESLGHSSKNPGPGDSGNDLH